MINYLENLVEATGSAGIDFTIACDATSRPAEELREGLRELVESGRVCRIGGTVPGSTATYVATQHRAP